MSGRAQRRPANNSFSSLDCVLTVSVVRGLQIPFRVRVGGEGPISMLVASRRVPL